jgi:hypothetical protein
MTLKPFQIWYNKITDEIYETRFSIGGMMMYTSLYGGMFIDDSFVNNSDNGWVYITAL